MLSPTECRIFDPFRTFHPSLHESIAADRLMKSSHQMDEKSKLFDGKQRLHILISGES